VADLYATEIDAYIDRQMRENRIPGLSLAIVLNGRCLANRAYGLADVTGQIPVTASTKFQLASVTKTFVATAIMSLAESCALGLDDTVLDHMPEFPARWGEISVRRLLNHTAGLPEYLNRFAQSPSNSAREILEWAADMPLRFLSGTRQEYSNTNFVLLGEMIRRVTGLDYGDFLHQHMFHSCGMWGTGKRWIEDPELAVAYVQRNGCYEIAPHLRPGLWDNADGGLVSSAADMALWARGLQTNTILTADSQKRMWAKTRLPDGSIQNYGFGLYVDVYQYGRSAGHGGGRPGVQANFTTWMRSESQLSVAVLMNVSLGDNTSFQIGYEIAKIVDPVWR